MSLQVKLRQDMVAAMKSGDTDTRDLIRVAAGEFGREMNNGIELSDDRVLEILKKMKQDATDLGNLGEVEILDRYLPQMFSETQIKLVINKIIQDNGYSGMQDMGKVMSEIKSPSIDGKIASKITRELLTQ
jgi:uncharacterized protein YqeY